MDIKVGDMVRLCDGAVGRVERIGPTVARVMGTNGVVYKEQPIASLQLIARGESSNGFEPVIDMDGCISREQAERMTRRDFEIAAPSVSPDIVDRMVRLVRDVASTDAVGDQMHKIIENRMEASRLLRLLPSEPFNPLVQRAREMLATELDVDAQTNLADEFREGKRDATPAMRAVLAALRDRP